MKLVNAVKTIKVLAGAGWKYTYDSGATIATGFKAAAVTGKNIGCGFKDAARPHLEAAAGMGKKMGSQAMDGCKGLAEAAMEVASKPVIKKVAVIGLKATAGYLFKEYMNKEEYKNNEE